MRDEQREAIDTLKEITENDLLNYWEGPEKPYNAIDTVLSLIKEQEEEIGNLQKELNEENKRCMILANNDKFKEQVIDLMAEYWNSGLAVCENCIDIVENYNKEKCKQCIKQYFENKVNSSEQ